MRRVIRLENNGACACLQLSLIIAHTLGCVEFIARAGEMEHIKICLAICWTRFPVAGNATADPDNSAQPLSVRESKTIVERARLREAEQKDACWIGEALFSQPLDQIDKCSMMKRDRFLSAKVCQPAETETHWTTGFTRLSHVLVKPLQRCDSESLRRHQLSFAHHVTLVRAVTVQRNQQRRR